MNLPVARRAISSSAMLGAVADLVLDRLEDDSCRYAPWITVPHIFAEWAKHTPDAPAALFGETALTYAELDRRANQIAHHIRSFGAGPEITVGLCLERSLEMIVSLMGILKAGAIYLPLDPDYPAERLEYMLKDAGASVLITATKLRDRFAAYDIQVVQVDADQCAIAAQPTIHVSNSIGRNHAAYVIYTSGSTGMPKGVIGTHGGIVNRVLAQTVFDPLSVDDVCCQKTSIGFVDSIFEIVGPLTAGACLIVYEFPSNDLTNLAGTIARHRVTRLVTVPSLASALVTENTSELKTVRTWTLSGEAVDSKLLKSLVRAFRTAGLSIFTAHRKSRPMPPATLRPPRTTTQFLSGNRWQIAGLTCSIMNCEPSRQGSAENSTSQVQVLRGVI